MRQTKNSSYKKLFSVLEDSENFFELDILNRIQDDYIKYHTNNLNDYLELIDKDFECPKCNSNDVIKHGKNKSGSLRYKCKSCGKTFSSLEDTLFFSSKVNIRAWLAFLECVLSGSSTQEACIVAKISVVTGAKWMKKIFKTLRDYQKDVTLGKTVYIDETYVHEDASKIYLLEEVGKIKKVRKQPRGISRNKICILMATDETQSIGQIVCHGRPQRKLVYDICKKHITNDSTLIGDIDTSLTYTSKLMELKRETYKSNTYEAYKKLEPIDQLCARFKFFIDKHRGFKKDVLQDYINLFIFIENTKNHEKDLYKITIKLFSMMFDYKKVTDSP